MQLFYNLSDPAMEDALYEIESMRCFAGLKLDRLPDETTILKFRQFPGTPRPWQGVVQRGEQALGEEWLDAARRQHCGCQHHFGTELHQERKWSARSRDVPDPKGQPMVL